MMEIAGGIVPKKKLRYQVYSVPAAGNGNPLFVDSFDTAIDAGRCMDRMRQEMKRFGLGDNPRLELVDAYAAAMKKSPGRLEHRRGKAKCRRKICILIIAQSGAKSNEDA